MHIVLFRVQREIRQSSNDWIVWLADIYCIINNTTWMSHPLAADHKLILSILAERIRHTPMPSSKTSARFDGFEQTVFMLLGHGSHTPDRYNQIHCLHCGIVQVNVQRIRNGCLILLALQKRRKEFCVFFWFIPIPSSPYKQCCFHYFPSIIHKNSSDWPVSPNEHVRGKDQAGVL